MKKAFIISMALIGLVLAVTCNSWAQRESNGQRHPDRGSHFQKWDNPKVHKFDRDRNRVYRPGSPPHHPNPHFRPHIQKRHQIHKLRRHWRPGLPKWRYWRYRRPAVIHRHYGSAPNAFQTSATLSDSGFAVFVGVSQAN
jgi:hypothetical protein